MKINHTRSATYIGDVAELRGEKALVIFEGDLLMAQFNGPADMASKVKFVHPTTGEMLCFGWHKFFRNEFEVHPEEPIEPTPPIPQDGGPQHARFLKGRKY